MRLFINKLPKIKVFLNLSQEIKYYCIIIQINENSNSNDFRELNLNYLTANCIAFNMIIHYRYYFYCGQ